MAEYGDLQMITMAAGADLSANRYNVVRVSAARTVLVASLNTSRTIIGVLQNKPKSGESAGIAVGGITKMVAGAAISADALITCNASGRAITKVASGTYVCFGRALDAAYADGEVISVLLQSPVEFTG